MGRHQIPEVSEQKPKELAYRMNEMQVQKMGKESSLEILLHPVT